MEHTVKSDDTEISEIASKDGNRDRVIWITYEGKSI